MNINPLAKSRGIVMQEVKDECLLYNLETNKALSLNPTAYFVWKNCDGQTGVKQIAANLSREFNAKIEEDYVFLALEELRKADLLAKSESFASDKISRRKVLIKYGIMAAMLPIVTGIIAPKAVQAASVCAGGATTCSVAGDCPLPTAPACSDPGCSCSVDCVDSCCVTQISCF